MLGGYSLPLGVIRSRSSGHIGNHAAGRKPRRETSQDADGLEP